MGKVVLDMAMSLDGFVTGPNPTREHGLGTGKGEQLHHWLFSGNEPSRYSDFFKAEGASRAVVDEMFMQTGAMVVGRKLYDLVDGWGGSHPIPGLVIFVVTHHPPKSEDVPIGGSTFIFVTDGIESAIRQAKAAAGDKQVIMHGASMAQQALKAGVLDEVLIHLAPILLGDGVRLFDHAQDQQRELECTRLIEAPGVTHLYYKVKNP